ncbi:MAG: hypothetical protein Q8Q15_02595 [bacterium]|nr:hypothetical protein [bacterium]
MRKEVLIAIILGFALGLVITFGVWSANRAMKEKDVAENTVEEEVETLPTSSPTPTSATFSLVILSPADESFVDKDKISINGSTEPGAEIAVITENGEAIVVADESGKFDAPIILETGTNEITVTAVNAGGDEVTKTINIVYSTSAN